MRKNLLTIIFLFFLSGSFAQQKIMSEPKVNRYDENIALGCETVVNYAAKNKKLGKNRIDSKRTADYYIKNILLGTGIWVGDVTHVGMIGGVGQFQADSTMLGLSSGIVLSTGSVDSIFAKNRSIEYTSFGAVPDSLLKNRTMVKGDKDLNKLCKGITDDVTVIEFDFVPVQNSIEFRYVFASDEYNEYVGSRYNDVFGFFLDGPGVKGGTENLAVLPNGRTPISINSINLHKNRAYFRDNSVKAGKRIFISPKKKKAWKKLRANIEFDGLTTVLTVKHDVQPYKKYHIKIAIGDVSDNILDSGVFLEAGSFSSIVDSTGKYFDKLEKVAANPPNVDSILHKDKYVVEKPVITENTEEDEADEFRITDIYFDFNATELTVASVEELAKLADYLRRHKSGKCTLVGYTDNVGSKSYNQQLSEQRALKVIDFLVDQGIARDRLNYAGRNFEHPRYDNTSEEGRAKNRRVEIVLED